MPSRAAHTKSRNGCIRCKARRVKCDEGRPCRDCHRRNELCSLVTDPVYIARFKDGQSTSDSQSRASPSGSSVPSGAGETSFSLPILSAPVYLGPGSSIHYPALTKSYSDWTDDLFLMAHYTSTTSGSLFNKEEYTPIFRHAVPEAAIGYPHTMHVVLAVSAAQLAKHTADRDLRKKYSNLSTKHHHHAIAQFQDTVKNVTKENITAVFLTSSLLTSMSITVLMEPPGVENPLHPDMTFDEINAVMTMVRGLTIVLGPRWHWLTDSRIQFMLKRYSVENHVDLDLPVDMADQLAAIREHLIKTDRTAYHDGSKEACTFALLELEKVYKDVVHYPCQLEHLYDKDFRKRHDLETGVIVKWCTYVGATYVDLLKQKHPVAVIIVLHWAVLWKHWTHMWFSEGWAENAYRVIKAELSEEDQRWLEWPRKYLDYK